jgi:hypothetical protein
MHDIVLYYGTGLQLFGTDVGNHWNEIDQTGLVALGFEFFKTGPESGYENAYVNVIQKMNGKACSGKYRKESKSRLIL